MGLTIAATTFVDSNLGFVTDNKKPEWRATQPGEVRGLHQGPMQVDGVCEESHEERSSRGGTMPSEWTGTGGGNNATH